MDFSQLRYFREVARLQHFTQAAEQQHITQPALSKIIGRLESELGARLFDRDGKSVRLNDYGRIVLEHTDRIFAELDEMQARISDMQDGSAGFLNIGSSFPVREPRWLVDTLRDFVLQRPNVRVRMRQMNPQRLIEALLDREVDLALSSPESESTAINWTPLFIEPMGLLLSRNHPLAAKATVSMSELENERFLCNNANSDVPDLTRSFCRRAGFEPDIVYEGDFHMLIGEATSMGIGVSFISEPVFRARDAGRMEPWETDLTFRSITEPYCERACGIGFVRDRYLPKVTREFHDYLVARFTDGDRGSL